MVGGLSNVVVSESVNDVTLDRPIWMSAAIMNCRIATKIPEWDERAKTSRK